MKGVKPYYSQSREMIKKAAPVAQSSFPCLQCCPLCAPRTSGLVLPRAELELGEAPNLTSGAGVEHSPPAPPGDDGCPWVPFLGKQQPPPPLCPRRVQPGESAEAKGWDEREDHVSSSQEPVISRKVPNIARPDWSQSLPMAGAWLLEGWACGWPQGGTATASGPWGRSPHPGVCPALGQQEQWCHSTWQ